MSCHSASVRSEVYRIRSVLRECIYIHCHPVEGGDVCWKGLNMSDLHSKNDVIDFDFVCGFFAARAVPNLPHAHRKANFLSSHGLGSWRTISPLCQPLPGQLSDSQLLLLGPVPGHALRPNH